MKWVETPWGGFPLSWEDQQRLREAEELGRQWAREAVEKIRRAIERMGPVLTKRRKRSRARRRPR